MNIKHRHGIDEGADVRPNDFQCQSIHPPQLPGLVCLAQYNRCIEAFCDTPPHLKTWWSVTIIKDF